MFNNFEIVQMPLSLRRNRIMVEEFLTTNELRLDDMDYYAAVVDNDSGIMLAGGGSNDPDVFNPEMFDTRRLYVAPILIIVGFIIEIVAIMLKPKTKE